MTRHVHLTICRITLYTVLRCKAAQFAVLAAVNSKVGILRYVAITGPKYALNRNLTVRYISNTICSKLNTSVESVRGLI